MMVLQVYMWRCAGQRLGLGLVIVATCVGCGDGIGPTEPISRHGDEELTAQPVPRDEAAVVRGRPMLEVVDGGRSSTGTVAAPGALGPQLNSVAGDVQRDLEHQEELIQPPEVPQITTLGAQQTVSGGGIKGVTLDGSGVNVAQGKVAGGAGGKGYMSQDKLAPGKGGIKGAGGTDQGSTIVQGSHHKRLRFVAAERRSRQHDILWVVENGSSMVRHQYHTQAAQYVRGFIRKHASDDYRIGLITAQDKQAQLCVPRIYGAHLDFAWMLDVSLVKESFVKISCAIETLSPLQALQQFFRAGGELAGVKVGEFVRAGAAATIIVVSDGFALQAHGREFKAALFKYYPQRQVRFYGFAATGKDPKQPQALQLAAADLRSEYADMVGDEVYYHGACGHLYTPGYQQLAEDLGGAVFGICEPNWTPHLKTIATELKQRSYQRFVLTELQNQAFSLLDVKVDGVSISTTQFVLDPQPVPVLYFTTPVITREQAVVDVVIQPG